MVKVFSWESKGPGVVLQEFDQHTGMVLFTRQGHPHPHGAGMNDMGNILKGVSTHAVGWFPEELSTIGANGHMP